MLVTFELFLRFYFYKMLDRLELNFLLIDHLSICLPVTTRQQEPWGDFAKNGSHWHYLGAGGSHIKTKLSPQLGLAKLELSLEIVASVQIAQKMC